MSCGIFSLRNVTSGDRDPSRPGSWDFDLLADGISSDDEAVDGAVFDDEDDDDEDEGTEG
jgi:hypothetical protein